jgi:hypothetical protein
MATSFSSPRKLSARRRKPLRWCVVAVAFVASVQSIRMARTDVYMQGETLLGESSGSSREPAGTSSLPEGGYLAYRSPPELEYDACQASVSKKPVRGRLDRAVVLVAQEQLNLPMGVGRLLVVRGQPYLFCLEPHYHPPGGGVGPEGWHKGVTVYHGSLSGVRVL